MSAPEAHDMRPDVAVHLDSVWVRYVIRNAHDYNLKRTATNALSGRRGHSETIDALRGISLSLTRGTRLGLIGPNGSGKSTLLAVMAGVLAPSDGSAMINGRVLALLGGPSEGLDPEQTGRENVISLGVRFNESADEMEERMEEIRQFTGLGRRFDHPVHTYSSGMQARLRFTTITSIRADVLLVDEGIGAADPEFNERASVRLTDFYRASQTLVLASHSKETLENYCTSVAEVNQGTLLFTSSPFAGSAVSETPSVTLRGPLLDATPGGTSPSPEPTASEAAIDPRPVPVGTGEEPQSRLISDLRSRLLQSQRGGDWVTVAESLRCLLALDPNDEASLQSGLQALVTLESETPLRKSLAESVLHNQDRIKILIRSAAQLRSMGESAAAIEALLLANDLDETNPEIAMELGLLYRRTHEHERAMDWFQSAYSIDPGNAWTSIHLAVSSRDVGQFDQSRVLLLKVLQDDPHNNTALRELLETLRCLDDEATTRALLLQAASRTDYDEITVISLAEHLRRLGYYQSALKLIEDFVAFRTSVSPRVQFEGLLTESVAQGSLSVNDELLELAKDRPRDTLAWFDHCIRTSSPALQLADYELQLEDVRLPVEDSELLSGQQVADIIYGAIRRRQPFSLIRLGDGEGGFSFASRIAETESPSSNTQFAAVLLGEAVSSSHWGTAWATLPEEEIRRFRTSFLEAVNHADVLGVPSLQQLTAVSAGARDLIGPIGVAEARRLACNSEGKLTTAQVNVDLHGSADFYRTILRELDHLGLVTCHAQLPGVIRDQFGVASIDLHLVPAHAGLDTTHFGYSATAGTHFPAVLNRIQTELKVPFTGAVYFVAAGILGKVYCDWIKQRGGVAIDIGAMADFFVGWNTRGSIQRILDEHPLFPVD